MTVKAQKPTIISPLAWGLLFLTTFFYTFQNLVRVSPSVMINNILCDFNINAAQFGQFSGAYYLGYAGMHIPLGIAFDRLKLKYVLSLSIILMIVGLIPLYTQMPWSTVVIGRVLVGAGSSGAILGMFKVFRSYFPTPWFSILLGSTVTIGVLGSIYGGRPIDIISQNIGYRNVIFWMIVLGILLSITSFFVANSIPNTTKQESSALFELKAVLKNKTILFISLFGGFMVGPLEGFADVWALPFLETVYGFERSIAASLPSLIYIGFSIGCPLIAVISERYKSHFNFTVMCGGIMAILFTIILTCKPNYLITGAIFLLIGIFSGYQVLTMTLNVQHSKPEQAGIVTALTNMIVMSFGSFFHTTISSTMHLFWDGKFSGSTPVYTATDYIFGATVIPIFLLLGTAGIMWQKYSLAKK